MEAGRFRMAGRAVGLGLTLFHRLLLLFLHWSVVSALNGLIYKAGVLIL